MWKKRINDRKFEINRNPPIIFFFAPSLPKTMGFSS